jgi:hypothetical protein
MDCVTFPSMNSVCLKSCGMQSDCPTSPAGSTCQLQVTDPMGDTVIYCSIPCSIPGTNNCPLNTSCVDTGDDTYECSP